MTEREYQLLKAIVDALGHSSEIVVEAEASAEAGFESLPTFVSLTVSWKPLKQIATIIDSIPKETMHRMMDEAKDANDKLQ